MRRMVVAGMFVWLVCNAVGTECDAQMMTLGGGVGTMPGYVPSPSVPYEPAPTPQLSAPQMAPMVAPPVMQGPQVPMMPMPQPAEPYGWGPGQVGSFGGGGFVGGDPDLWH